ncbi:3-methyladenine DNA glycosylase [uncultured Williamsia sp.]|uniref:3-methyladenine DNA glycosylase n=1 Tax=uncultured Williamsia sp. TaxID=259311 RepID=UPI002602DABF|nr:3-methyladenine DNA glycosylase [uncultured Williamsia sp.]
MRVLTVDDWTTRAADHAARVGALLDAHPQHLPDGRDHPVWQFLFRYYSHKPARLRRWHPGFGVGLAGAPDHRDWPHYVRVDDAAGGSVVTVGHAHLDARRDTVAHVTRLLSATAGRAPRWNCFGLHEWAMVYRDSAVRRHHVPLRLSPAETDRVVDRQGLRCTHFDAFRFFTDDAVGRNTQELTRATQVATEQPGCVHAGMDLYKWATKLEALVGSDVVVDALALAFDLRELDMRASPYDLRDLGFAPVAVETPRGRAQYVAHQRELADRAASIRSDLLARCRSLASATTVDEPLTTAE